MQRPIFGHSFAVLVAPILLSVLAFSFLNKKKASERENAKDSDSGTYNSSTAAMVTNAGGSSSSPTETNNGASSLMTGNSYEVFLSFRGPDTRNSFTDHLYNGLIGAGICAFRDDEELCQGKEIGPDLLAAIKNSKILIPILSENYGESSWCLDELVQIMECKNNNSGMILLPIFYKVAPADVRHQIGSFGKAFHERENRSRERGLDPTILEKWKQALRQVGNLKGREANGSEAELVKSVVQQVLLELKKQFELVVPENLVGIDCHVTKVMEFVDNNSHATLFIGIHGMGGIGKTTLAKTIYNKLSNRFEYRSFIADIRESWKHNGVHYLQNQLIYDILKQENQVRNKDEGINFLSSMLEGKKVLILLDDVDDDDHLKALAGKKCWFSSGSRIIITTRNKSILDKVGMNYTFEHKEMDKDKSLILFSRHAFRRDFPPSEFEDLTSEVVSTTGGLPLSLEVLGSFLCGKQPNLWRGMIKKLRKVPHKKVQEKLKISYEALTHEQKQIFLDIACFFIGIDRRIVTYMWDACDFFPEEGIEVLRFLSLIKVGDNHELIMHDQLRDLGREIVREENKKEPRYRSRLWDTKEVLKVLKGNEGTEKIEAIYLNKASTEAFSETTDQDGEIYTSEQFKNLTNLRFLDASGAHFSGDFKNSIKELKWLQWQNCPCTFEANNFPIKELVVLNLSKSKVSDKWHGWSFIKLAEKLKFLDLTSCGSLEGTFFLSRFKNLEVLILRDCPRLEQIDSSIGDMKSLLRLDLTACRSLKELPAEVGKLKSLEELLIGNCGHISSLPDSIRDLHNLEILDISRTEIRELPSDIGRLRNLQDLDASWCTKLGGEIPESIGNLSSLQRLNFHDCFEIQSLPMLPSSLTYMSVTCRSRQLPWLSHLTCLKELLLIYCHFHECIWELPPTSLKFSESPQLTDAEESELQNPLNTPYELQILDISCCLFMETLDVSHLNHLRTLSVHFCDNLLEVRGLNNLKYLERLSMMGCPLITKLDLPKFESLKILVIQYFETLAEIQGLNRLEFLKELNIDGCTLIERLNLPKGLTIFNACCCEKLVEIQSLNEMEFLENLRIYMCASIERLDLSKFKGLKNLCAQECKNLVEIQGLHRLKFLEELQISECDSIERLDLPDSEYLKSLTIRSCENLVEIQCLDRLKFLEMLSISWCASIERLNLPKSKGLKYFTAQDLEKVTKIQGLDRFETLEMLSIFKCTLIQRLDLPKSKVLKVLTADNCANLVEIEGLNRLKFLEQLHISECPSIERLDLSKSESLQILYAEKCEKLVEIRGLDRLEFLEMLFILGCTYIERLDLPMSKGLKILHAKQCNNLVDIQGLDRLKFLEEIYISGCASIERLDLSQSEHLKILNAGYCEKLVEMQGLDRLKFLKELYIPGCVSIKRLDLPKSENLNILDVGYCENLVKIEGLYNLKLLEKLYIFGCNSIERLDLPESEGLKILDAKNCKNLVEIHGLHRLKFLEELYISGCTSIERLDLPKSMDLNVLDAQNCENLVKIEGLDGLEFLKMLNIRGCTLIERLDLPRL
ncbi:hypothetical protein ACJRO7_014439 [Eucalyptus globulus]|uniref:TIR domain-containing protein n=1 Tax=Eucalyptus globulus TaxID=34317 RepID=A0ABD3L145_EUCGL